MAKVSSAKKPSPRQTVSAPPFGERGWQWLTDAGLVLAMGAAGARMLMNEPLKQGLTNPLPGMSGSPLGPGPATGLVLDLICWLPAIAVLLRRVTDPNYTLRRTGAMAVMGALGLWAVVSMAWSADRFTAIVSAFHLLSAMILLWAAAQSVRSWTHLRCVAGLCAGLFLALAVKGYTDHFVDAPMLRQKWEQEKNQVMQEHNWTPDSFDYKQFQLRVLGGQIMGFSQSPNTYAGLLVLLATVTAGLVLDRRMMAVRVIGVLATIGIAAPLVIWTQCRAAYATPVLAAACLALVGRYRKWLAEHAWPAFIGVAAAILAGFAAIVGYGLARGNLVHSSLTFRWWYWVGSARMIKLHPLLGVGWGNFGPSYLGVRLPIASEEIIDPHNFIMQFFTELGVIGGGLLLVWLGWMAWRITAGASDRWEKTASEMLPPRGGWLWWMLAGPMAAILLNLPASIDFSTPPGSDAMGRQAFMLIEVENRTFWLLAMVAGMALALLRRKPAGRGQIVLGLESSPAGWTVRAMLVGLGIFLVHNLIEFGLFEPGPMFLFALICGTALGLRLADPPAARRGRSNPAIAALAGSMVLWMAAAALLVAPVENAEGLAENADDLIRINQPEAAQSALESAAAACPYNPEYLLRAANAALQRRPPDIAGAIGLLGRAVAVDPLYSDAYLLRASLKLQPVTASHLDDSIADDRQALKIDPNNMRLHLELADLLEKLGRPSEAGQEYQTVVRLDHALEPGDPKRLPKQEIEAMERGLGKVPQ
jgi:hypothetical protein